MTRDDRSSPHPGRADPRRVAAFIAHVRPVVRRLWPWSLHGVEHLPKTNDFLLVANHSGLGLVECLALFDAWIERVGPERPLAAMANSALFRAPVLGDLLRAAGTVEATHEAAAHARRSDAALLLFPGGDREAMRPIWRSREVDFAQRRGFIRLAREHRLQIVPLAITGSHVTIPNLGSVKVPGAHRLGIPRLPLPALSVAALFASFAMTRGASMPARVGFASMAYASTAFVPFIPATLGFHLMPTIDPALGTEAEVYDATTTALRSVLRRR